MTFELTGNEIFDDDEKELIRKLDDGKSYVKWHDDRLEEWEYIYKYEGVWYTGGYQYLHSKEDMTYEFRRELYGKILLGIISEMDENIELIEDIEDFHVLDLYMSGMVYKKDDEYYRYESRKSYKITKPEIVYMILNHHYDPYIREMTCEEVEDII